jgi:threonine-phosphate decarboxylase
LLEACEVLHILDQTRSAGATLLADEAFIDYAPHASVVKAAVEPGLIVLRSLTKFYGCPALRVGYAVATPEMAQHIASLLPTWPVTQLALNALTEAVADREYADESLQENELARERLAASLRALGVAVAPSGANYLLVELNASMPCASELRIRMIEKHHILIRNCDSYEGMEPGRFVRVAVRSVVDNQRLLEALAKEISI